MKILIWNWKELKNSFLCKWKSHYSVRVFSLIHHRMHMNSLRLALISIFINKQLH